VSPRSNRKSWAISAGIVFVFEVGLVRPFPDAAPAGSQCPMLRSSWHPHMAMTAYVALWRE